MLGSSIWQSRRFNRLGTDGARLAFCYVISNEHGNILGTYRLNPRYMAADRNISSDQAEAELEDMAQVGLVDYDGAEGLIHIRKWFDFNRITNRNYLVGAIRALRLLPQSSHLVGMVAADVVLSAFSTAEEFDDLDAMQIMQNIAKQGCGNLIKRHRSSPYLKEITTLAPQSLLEALHIHLGYTFEGLPDDREGERKKRERDSERESPRGKPKSKPKKNRKRKTPEPASAPGGRAASTTENNRPSVVLQAGADYVIKVVKDKRAVRSGILPPDTAQLDAMLAKGMISEAQRDTFLSRGTA